MRTTKKLGSTGAKNNFYIEGIVKKGKNLL